MISKWSKKIAVNKCNKHLDKNSEALLKIKYLLTLPVKMPRPNPWSSASLIWEGPIHNPHPTTSASLLLPSFLVFRALGAAMFVGKGQVPPPQPLSSAFVSSEDTDGKENAINATKHRVNEIHEKEQFERAPDPIVRLLYVNRLV